MKNPYGLYNSEIGVESSSYSTNESYEHFTCKWHIVEKLRINSTPAVILKRAEAEQIRNIVTGESLGFTPDIQAITEDDELIFIEIVKTSDIDPKKMKMIEHADVTTIKIYVDNTYSRDTILNIVTAYCKTNSLYNNLYYKSVKQLDKFKTKLIEYQETIQELQKLIK